MFEFQDTKFVFSPDLGPAKMFYKKIRIVLQWLIIAALITIGLYGLVILFVGVFQVFYATLLADMFLIYLWNRKQELIKKIKPLSPAYREDKINTALFLDKKMAVSLDEAWKIAYESGYRFVRPIHLFISFLDNKDFQKILKRLNCRLKAVEDKAYKILKNSASEESGEGGWGPQISPELEATFITAYLFCLRQGCEQVSFLELLWAMSQQRNLTRAIFEEFGITPKEIARAVSWGELERQIR